MEQSALPFEYPEMGHWRIAHHELVLHLQSVVLRHGTGSYVGPEVRTRARTGPAQ